MNVCAFPAFYPVAERCAVPTWARSLRESVCPPDKEGCDVRVRAWLWWEADVFGEWFDPVGAVRGESWAPLPY